MATVAMERHSAWQRPIHHETQTKL